MKKLLVLFGLLAAIGYGQTALTTTTLSAAVNANQTSFQVASATGIVAPSFGTSNFNPASGNQTILFVDKEAMFVTAISGTTVSVIRGWGATVQNGAGSNASHVSGATVYVGQPAAFSNNEKSGACLSTAELYLPVINLTNGHIFDCRSSGQWMMIGDGTMVGSGSQVGVFCTGNLGSAETEYLNDAACSSATTATAGQVQSSSGTIANLYVSAGTGVTGGTGKDVATVYKNGSATALTCTIAASGTSCSDKTHSVAVAAGDVLTFQFVTATTDAGANVRAFVGKY